MAFIELKDVCIDFPIPKSRLNVGLKRSLRHAIGGKLKSSVGVSYVRALDTINLHLTKGDRVGLVGHNGAGKTTLLRVLAGVYPPSSGEIKCKGRIASLLDISLGFDLEASGIENIFLRGLYLGLSKQQISKCVDKISNFTNLGDYLSMPIRTYSSGMLMRLAFAITTEVEPDIILMDEWISVGDAKFMEQAKERLESFISTSSIMVLASHSEDLIRSTCNKAILLGQGEILAQGSVDEVYHHYNFFGSSAFFNIDEYISIHPDLEASMSVPGMAPWMHFIRYGIFEGRSPGCGISLEAFDNDPVFASAIQARNGLAAAERIENIAPFLSSFVPPKGWRQNKELSYPDEFIETDGHPLISIEESLAKYS
ncbi:MAG: hypothetical protein CMJ13_08670 [Pelagibacterales bacterium]|nr:hypothetical protein [Pelagibacterales bacterium]